MGGFVVIDVDFVRDSVILLQGLLLNFKEVSTRVPFWSVSLEDNIGGSLCLASKVDQTLD